MSYALNNYQIAFLAPPNAQNSPRGGILANIFFNFDVLMNIILNETPNVLWSKFNTDPYWSMMYFNTESVFK